MLKGHKIPCTFIKTCSKNSTIHHCNWVFMSSLQIYSFMLTLTFGKVDVLFYPCKETCDIEQYDDFQQEKLLQGKSVIDDVVTNEGNTIRAFIQVDKETNHVIYVPTPVIGKNIQILAEDFGLSTAELQSLHNGEPFTFMTDSEPLTVGIDLRDKTGIRFCTGDIARWMELGQKTMSKYNFGINGCWIKNDDGSLDNVKEDDYTEEIMAEL